MAYKRKRTFSRNTRRTRRKTYTRRPIRRVPRGIMSNNIHMFKRSYETTSLTTAPSSAGLTAFAPRFDDLPNFSEFVNLYDQYRINKIKVTIVPNWTEFSTQQMDVNQNQGVYNLWPTGNPNIHTVIDYDNTGMAGYGTAEMMQFSTYKRTRGNMEHSRYWTPAIQMGAQINTNSAAASTAAVQKYRPWLDMSTADVPHYGLKILTDPFQISNAGSDQTNGYTFARVYITLYFQCKGVR